MRPEECPTFCATAGTSGSALYGSLDDDRQMLMDIEQNIANLERSLIHKNPGNNNTNRYMVLKFGIKTTIAKSI